MASASFHQVPNALGDYYQQTGFSHAVVLPANAQLVITAGQSGINTETGKFGSVTEQIECAFDNCDAALKAAGVKDGLARAHKIQCFLLDVAVEPEMMAIWRRRFPDHRPTWMTVGTNALCGPEGMAVEVQAEAHLVPGESGL